VPSYVQIADIRRGIGVGQAEGAGEPGPDLRNAEARS
jgi:hypothetical protein